jgi:hypothetical protein
LKKRNLLVILVVAGLLGCSSSSNTGTTKSAVGNALTVATEKISAIVPDTSGVAALSLLPERVSMNAEWVTEDDYSLGGDFGSSPRNFVRNNGDETAQGSLMYRLNQALESLCIFAEALPSSGGAISLSAGGTTTLTAAKKAQIVTNCGVSLDELPEDGTVVGYKSEDISAVSGTEYLRKVSFDLQGGTNYTDYFYYTINSTTTRFTYFEGNSSTAFFDYSSTTGIAKFEYSGKENGDVYMLHYRGILVEGSNLGRFVAQVHKLSPGFNDISTAIVSTYEGGGDEMAVTYSFDEGADVHDFPEGNACISTTDLTIATDNTLSCDGGAITGVNAASYTFDITDIDNTYLSTRDHTSTIQFTSLADVLTAGAAD